MQSPGTGSNHRRKAYWQHDADRDSYTALKAIRNVWFSGVKRSTSYHPRYDSPQLVADVV